MSKSKIEWTDATWNPVTGCTRISPGCEHCYAERMSHQLAGRCGYPLDRPFAVTLHHDRLTEPLNWKKPRRVFVVSMGDLFHEDVPDEFIDRVWAVMALSPRHTYQVLTKRAERMAEYFASVGLVRRVCGAVRGIVRGIAPSDGSSAAWRRWYHRYGAPSPAACLTAWLHDGGCAAEMFHRNEPDAEFPSWVTWPLPNVWLGVTAEDQQRADERIPHLLKTPAAVRFVSVEPMLGPVDLTRVAFQTGVAENVLACGVSERARRCGIDKLNGIDWVICGGESGPGARPMHPDWARSLRDQSTAAGVPFLFKQWGEWAEVMDRWAKYEATASELARVGLLEPDGRFWPVARLPHGETLQDKAQQTHCHEWDAWMYRVGKKAAGRMLDGRTWDEYPQAVKP